MKNNKKYFNSKDWFIKFYYLKSSKLNLLTPFYNKSRILSFISIIINLFNLVTPLFLFFILDIFFKTKNNHLLNIVFIICAFIILINYWLYNLRDRIVIKLKNIVDDYVFNNLMDMLFSIPNSTVEMKQDSFWLSLFNDIDVLKNTIKTEFFTKNIDISFIAVTIGIIMGLSINIGIIILPVSFFYLLVVYIFYKKIFSISSKENIAIFTRNNLIVSSIKNLSSVKSSILKDKIKSSWRDYQKNIDYKLLYKQSLLSGFDNILITLSSFCMLGLIYVLGKDLINNKLEISELIFTIFSMFISFNLVNKIIISYPDYLRFNRASNRLMALSSQIAQFKNGIDMKYPVRPVLETKAMFVSDSHGNRIINNLDMELHPGTLYIVKGKSPSVSSVILKCFTGIYPIENGNITISDYDINNVNVKTVTNYVRYFGNEVFVFYGSIKENMTCFHNNTVEEYSLLSLESLISTFNIDSIVESLPHGYNTIIDNNTDILSNEELKLINIIRSLIGNPSVILLDDPFSGLSNENRQKLIDLLISVSKDKLVIITSSNYDSYIKNSHIIFIKNGELEIKENEFVINNSKRRSLFKRISIH